VLAFTQIWTSKIYKGMTKDEQRAAAKDLFMLGWDQQEIARAVNVSQTTMTKWATVGSWREERAKKYGMDETRSDRILNLIDYQIEVLENFSKENRANHAAFKDFLRTNPGDEPTPQQIAEGRLQLLDKGHIDALSKLFATIKGKDMPWSNYVNMTRELIEFLSNRDNALAKSLVEHTDAFLMHKRDLIVT
jgi:hypothetical protein